MQIIDFSREHASPIELFESIAVSNVRIGGGQGEAHVYGVYFKAGGNIGEHPAGYAQLFLIVDGEGWAAGADGHRVPLLAGQGAYFAPGESHSKGSETGMTVIMVQAEQLTPEPLQ
jgi:quercetin dioxygenase-like cupin family protein